MGSIVKGKDITEAMHKAIRWQLDHPEPDAVLNIESHMYDLTLEADSCEYTLDVGKHLWLNKGRWSRLIKEYVPREPLNRLIAQAVEIVTGKARDGATANMMFRDPDRYAKKHRWGGCLMGITFRGNGDGTYTITFFSRTTYIGYMGLMDAAIAHVLAREIVNACGPECDLRLEEIKFRWLITSSQLHCFKTLPFIFSQPDLMKRLEGFARIVNKSPRAMPPTWRNMAKWYNKVLEHHKKFGVGMLDQEKYGPFRRIKRRWLEYKGHLKKAVPPSLPVSQLTFEKSV